MWWPLADKASSLAIADEVGLEPAGEPVLTGGGDEPVGDEHEGTVGEGDGFGGVYCSISSGVPIVSVGSLRRRSSSMLSFRDSGSSC